MIGVSPELESFEFQRLLKAELTMSTVRFYAVAFALVQVFTYYRPYPNGMLPLAVTAVVGLLVGNVILRNGLRRHLDWQSLRRLSIASMALDLVIASALTFVYAFDVETAIWAVIYILPLGGAIRFQRKGALAITAAATVLYTLREVFGAIVYDLDFLPTSISFRMGIAFVIAWVAGTMTNGLMKRHQQLEDLNHQLSSVNDSMHDFVSVASHDMRTPLSVISGLSAHLDEHGDTLSPEQSREFIAAVRRNAQSLERLVTDLLTTSNIEAGTISCRPALIDLRAAAQTAVAASGVSPDRIAVQDSEPISAWVDADHLQRILVNLLTNAHKYGAPPIDVSFRQAPDSSIICVSDSGNGVDPDFEARLFERFARAATNDSSTDGTGLGLAIVRGLAQVNGGGITYERNTPNGATFLVSLPDAEVHP